MAGPVGAMPRIVGRGMSLAVSRGDLPGSSLRLLAGSSSVPWASHSFCDELLSLSSSRKERCITSFTWTLICRSRLARSREMRRLASFRKPRA